LELPLGFRVAVAHVARVGFGACGKPGMPMADPAGHRERRPGESSAEEEAVTGRRPSWISTSPAAAVQLAGTAGRGRGQNGPATGPLCWTCLDGRAPWRWERNRGDRLTIQIVDAGNGAVVRFGSAGTGRLGVGPRRRSGCRCRTRWGREGAAGLLLLMGAPVLRVTGVDNKYPPSKCEGRFLPTWIGCWMASDRSLAWCSGRELRYLSCPSR